MKKALITSQRDKGDIFQNICDVITGWPISRLTSSDIWASTIVGLLPGVNLSYPWMTQTLGKSVEQFVGKMSPREIVKANKIRLRITFNWFSISKSEMFVFCKVCHGCRLMKWDHYFWVTFDHFWSEHHFLRHVGRSKNWLEPKTKPP